jgi:thaumarchaeosortase
LIPQALRQIKTRLFHAFSKLEIVAQDLYPPLTVVPVVIFYLINPKMFEIEWVGYATFAYASFFVVITWLIYRTLTKPSNKISLKGTVLSTATIFLYQFTVYNLGYSETIKQAGASLGIHGGWLGSWNVAFDLTFFAFYLTGLTISFFGVRSLKRLSAPIIYLYLTVSSILLDAFYPLASFTAFQIFIPYIVFTVGNLLPLFGISARSFSIQDQTGQIRSFMIVNKPRFLALEVNWPCAGVFSILIYFGLMYGLLQIWDTTKKRKGIYLTVGFIGTVLANILRIVALILLYTYFNADLFIFHQYIGALFFVTWITAFLFATFLIEKRRISQAKLVEKRINAITPISM